MTVHGSLDLVTVDPRLQDSATYLKDHLHEIPILVVPCIEGRFETAGVMVQASLYGSILPAVWSFLLALRARGLGACWTTDHLLYEAEAAQILGLPDTVTQAPCPAQLGKRNHESAKVRKYERREADDGVFICRAFVLSCFRDCPWFGGFKSLWRACALHMTPCAAIGR